MQACNPRAEKYRIHTDTDRCVINYTSAERMKTVEKQEIICCRVTAKTSPNIVENLGEKRTGLIQARVYDACP